MINIPGISPIHRRRAVAAFSPLDISGLQLWLDGSNLSSLYQDAARTTPVASDADVVGAMSDLSGNGRHATQSTTNKKPTYRAAVQNGRGVVRFDGVDDWIKTASASWTAQISVLIVARLSRDHSMFSRLLSGELDARLYAGTNPNEEIATFYGNGTAWGVTGAQSANSWLNTWRLVSSVNDGNDNQFIDGATITPRSNAMAAFSGGLTIGGRYGSTDSQLWQGDIAEILIYNSALSTTNRQAVENYLMAKWL